MMEKKVNPPRSQDVHELPLYDARPTLPLRPVDPDAPPKAPGPKAPAPPASTPADGEAPAAAARGGGG